jgi:hypothetical protein
VPGSVLCNFHTQQIALGVIIFIYLFFIFYDDDPGRRTQGLAHIRQTLHQLEPVLSALVIFEIGSQYMCWLTSIAILFVLPHIAGMTGMCHHA